MYSIYVLKSLQDNKLYIGRTDNLKRRIKEHAQRKVKSTKNRLPVVLIFYEVFKNKKDSIRRERYFKTTKGKKALKLMLRESLK